MRISNRRLFLKYALPCARVIVKRGNVKQEYVDSLILMVSKNRVPKENAESMFKVANAMCEGIARRMGKSSIDTKVIRQYFLLEHSKVVDDRYNLMKDFDPIGCKTYAGDVVRIGKDFAVVETELGRKKYLTKFARGISEGDSVIVHWNFVIERVPKGFFRMMAGRTDEE